MPNLSQLKRERMLAFLQKIKDEHRDDDDMLIALGEIESELTSKKYGLVWEQHEEAVDVMMRDNVPVFTEVPEREITAAPGQGYNFILEGDNLHSLRLLEKTHKGKIDIIYIDPPYNRGGNDFRYEDTFVEKQDGFRHSKWLSFMESRLRIAWQLLKSDGVIFISIDDFEMGALRMLCDDVFGEAFFLCNIVWQKRYSRENREAIGDAHEYILVYAKDKLKFKENRHLVPMSEEQAKVYKNPNNDPKGRWRAVPMTAQGYRPNQMYPIVDQRVEFIIHPKVVAGALLSLNSKSFWRRGGFTSAKITTLSPILSATYLKLRGLFPGHGGTTRMLVTPTKRRRNCTQSSERPITLKPRSQFVS